MAVIIKTEFNIGDVCRIRSYEDMAAEFGQEFDSIPVKFKFHKTMSHLCGRQFTVAGKEFVHGFDCNRYFSLEKVEEERNGGLQWFISADMLELMPVEHDLKPASKSELSRFLGRRGDKYE